MAHPSSANPRCLREMDRPAVDQVRAPREHHSERSRRHRGETGESCNLTPARLRGRRRNSPTAAGCTRRQLKKLAAARKPPLHPW